MTTITEDSIEHINDTFREGDIEGFLALCSEEVHWHMLGRALLEGKDAIRQDMEGVKQQISLKRIIRDGNLTASEGIIITHENKKYAFCDIFEFEEGKIKELISYVHLFS